MGFAKAVVAKRSTRLLVARLEFLIIFNRVGRNKTIVDVSL